MIIDSPIFSGSYAATGSLNQIGNVTITGSLTVTGTINASITGSITTASYALSAELLDGLDSTSFVFTSSFNTVSSSFSTRVTNLENFSSSLDATFATDAELAAVSQSFSSSLSTVSGSLSSRVTNNEVTGSNLTTASGSFSTRTTNLELASGSFSTRVTDLETASGSFSTRVTTAENNITNLQNASSSFSTRVTSAENSIVSIQGATGSYATTGSNNFVGTQYISATNNAIGFTTTASLYTDGGIRVAKDMYVSGNAYFNNVTIYGTQSVQYITSSQLNISTNLISVNTDTPTIRFGGLAVYDSGSTGLSGSLLWDSEQNHWVYSNPSGSSYSGGMLISGPRASSLGTEQGTTACALMMGQGGDHITSSAIFHYGNATCFYGTSYIGSNGVAQFNSCVSVNTNNNIGALTVSNGNIDVASLGLAGCSGLVLSGGGYTNNIIQIGFGYINGPSNYAPATIGFKVDNGSGNTKGDLIFATRNSVSDIAPTVRATIFNTGEACFGNTVCALTFNSTNLAVSNGSSNVLLSSNNNEVLRIQGFCPSGMFTSFMSGSTVLGDVGNSNQAFSSGDATGFGVNARGSRVLQLGTNQAFRVTIAGTGETTFTCQVCAPSFISTGTICSTGNTCFGGNTTIAGNLGVGTVTPGQLIDVYKTSNDAVIRVTSCTAGAYIVADSCTDGYYGLILQSNSNQRWFIGGYTTSDLTFKTSQTGGSEWLRISRTSGVACFACQVCAPYLYVNGTAGNIASDTACGDLIQLYGGNITGTNCGIGIGFTRQGSQLGFIKAARENAVDEASYMIFATQTAAGSHPERMRITSTGIACFACQVCAPSFISSGTICTTTADGKNLDIGGVAVIRGNGSAYTTHYFTTGAVNVAKYLQYNASGVAVNQMAIDAHTYFNSGCNFGIGTTTPSYKLDISLPTTCTAVVARFNSPSYDEVHISAGLSNYIGTNSTSPFSLRTTNTNRLNIAGTGEATFTCQVCLREAVYICGTFPRLILDRSVTSAQSDVKFVDAGTSVWSIGTAVQAIGSNLDFYNYSLGGNVLKLTTTGEACFKYTVCAPQYITTQGSSVSYADGSNYLVWSSEGEYSAVDNNTTCTLTTMKTWIADRTGCVRLKFAGYISSGPTYWGWRIYRNGTSAYTCQSYATCLETGCSANVHGYTTFSVGIGPVNPGDCITLQMVSTGGGSVPAPGQGQTLYAKEFRIYSTTPNLSAGSTNNVFGDWVGIGTCIPYSNLYINGNNDAAYDATVDNGQDGCGVTLTVRNNSTVTNSFAQLNLQASGDSGRSVGRIVLIRKGSATGDMAFVTEDSNTKAEKLRITSIGNVGVGTSTPCGGSGERTIHLAGNSSTNATIYVSRDTYARTILGTNANGGITGTQSNHNLYIVTNDTARLFINNDGISCFACTVCAPSFISPGLIAGTTSLNQHYQQKFNGNYYAGSVVIANNSSGGAASNWVNLARVDDWSSANSRIIAKVTVLYISATSDQGNEHVGYALLNYAGTSYACPMTVSTGATFANSNVGTIRWCNGCLQYCAPSGGYFLGTIKTELATKDGASVTLFCGINSY